ncbi:MAG TPA: hypothetical protein VMB50_12235 [Myxococcales bacterium]|nr:hypothetical protein [Myxococcales bacterium]
MTGEAHWFPVAVVLVGLLAVGALWFFASSPREFKQTGWHSVVCPKSGMTFGVLALRDHGKQSWVDIVSCSQFFPRTSVTCAKGCLEQLNGKLVTLRTGS